MNQQFVGKWSTAASFAVIATWMRIPHPVQTLLILMGIDVISGLIKAARMRKLSSSEMMGGLLQKIALFPVLAMLHIIESPLKLSFELEAVAAYALMLVEAMSIIENAALSGAPIPRVIVDALAKAKIPTSSVAEIERKFSASDETKVSFGESSEILKTPDSQPDLKVTKKATLLEETHIEPIVDPTQQIPKEKS